MKFGLNQWRKQAPSIIYKIGDTLYAIATALGGYSLVAGQQWAIKVGAGCLILGVTLERLSGVKTNDFSQSSQ